ncbi:uncharacterized protein LOC121373497 [Gigantopelta aegis]|uniref:uncharacterized protein LOC121373497 n=1 Tax=Gigantopelta aegis TaxID=1735272 RepID=UPI001B88CEEC|nr:uncharacterized protein LOC121373497 [Gigantopelta aegis]
MTTKPTQRESMISTSSEENSEAIALEMRRQIAAEKARIGIVLSSSSEDFSGAAAVEKEEKSFLLTESEYDSQITTPGEKVDIFEDSEDASEIGLEELDQRGSNGDDNFELIIQSEENRSVYLPRDQLVSSSIEDAMVITEDTMMTDAEGSSIISVEADRVEESPCMESLDSEIRDKKAFIETIVKDIDEKTEPAFQEASVSDVDDLVEMDVMETDVLHEEPAEDEDLRDRKEYVQTIVSDMDRDMQQSEEIIYETISFEYLSRESSEDTYRKSHLTEDDAPSKELICDLVEISSPEYPSSDPFAHDAMSKELISDLVEMVSVQYPGERIRQADITRETSITAETIHDTNCKTTDESEPARVDKSAMENESEKTDTTQKEFEPEITDITEKEFEVERSHVTEKEFEPEIADVTQKELEQEITDIIEKETEPEITDTSKKELGPEITGVTEKDIEPEMSDITEKELEQEVTDIIETKLELEITDTSEKELEPEITDVTGKELESEMSDITEKEIEAEVTFISKKEHESEITDITEKQLEPEIIGTTETQLETEIMDTPENECESEITDIKEKEIEGEMTDVLKSELQPEITDMSENELEPEITDTSEKELEAEITEVAKKEIDIEITETSERELTPEITETSEKEFELEITDSTEKDIESYDERVDKTSTYDVTEALQDSETVVTIHEVQTRKYDYEVSELTKDDYKATRTTKDGYEVEKTKLDDYEASKTIKDGYEVEETTKDDYEVDQTTKDAYEVEQTIKDDHEVDETTQYDYEVDETTKDDHEADETTQDDYEAGERTKDEYKVAETTKDEYKVAETIKYGYEVAEIQKDDFEVDQTIKDDYEVDQTTKDDYEVDQTIKDDYEAGDTTNDDYELYETTKDDYEVQETTTDEYETVEATKDYFEIDETTKDDYEVDETTKDDYVVDETTKDDYEAGETTQYVYEASETTKDGYEVEETTQDGYEASETTKDGYEVEETTKDAYEVQQTTQDDYEAGDTTKDGYEVDETTKDDFEVDQATKDDYEAGEITKDGYEVDEMTKDDYEVEKTMQDDSEVGETTSDGYEVETTKDNYETDQRTQDGYEVQETTRDDYKGQETKDDYEVTETTKDEYEIEETPKDDYEVSETTKDEYEIEETTKDDYEVQETIDDFEVSETTKDEYEIEETTKDDYEVQETIDDFEVSETTKDEYEIEETTKDDYEVQETIDDFEVSETTKDEYEIEETTKDDYEVSETTKDEYEIEETPKDDYEVDQATKDDYEAGETTKDDYEAGETTKDGYEVDQMTKDDDEVQETMQDDSEVGETTNDGYEVEEITKDDYEPDQRTQDGYKVQETKDDYEVSETTKDEYEIEETTKDDYEVQETIDDFEVSETTKDEYEIEETTKDDYEVQETIDDFEVSETTKDEYEIEETKDDYEVQETKDDFEVSETTKDEYEIEETTKDDYEVSETTKDEYEIEETPKDDYEVSEATKDEYEIEETTKDDYEVQETKKDYYKVQETTKDEYQVSEATKDGYEFEATTKDDYEVDETTKDDYEAGETTKYDYEAGETTKDDYEASETAKDEYEVEETTKDDYEPEETLTNTSEQYDEAGSLVDDKITETTAKVYFQAAVTDVHEDEEEHIEYISSDHLFTQSDIFTEMRPKFVPELKDPEALFFQLETLYFIDDKGLKTEPTTDSVSSDSNLDITEGIPNMSTSEQLDSVVITCDKDTKDVTDEEDESTGKFEELFSLDEDNQGTIETRPFISEEESRMETREIQASPSEVVDSIETEICTPTTIEHSLTADVVKADLFSPEKEESSYTVDEDSDDRVEHDTVLEDEVGEYITVERVDKTEHVSDAPVYHAVEQCLEITTEDSADIQYDQSQLTCVDVSGEGQIGDDKTNLLKRHVSEMSVELNNEGRPTVFESEVCLDLNIDKESSHDHSAELSYALDHQGQPQQFTRQISELSIEIGGSKTQTDIGDASEKADEDNGVDAPGRKSFTSSSSYMIEAYLSDVTSSPTSPYVMSSAEHKFYPNVALVELPSEDERSLSYTHSDLDDSVFGMDTESECSKSRLDVSQLTEGEQSDSDVRFDYTPEMYSHTDRSTSTATVMPVVFKSEYSTEINQYFKNKQTGDDQECSAVTEESTVTTHPCEHTDETSEQTTVETTPVILVDEFVDVYQASPTYSQAGEQDTAVEVTGEELTGSETNVLQRDEEYMTQMTMDTIQEHEKHHEIVDLRESLDHEGESYKDTSFQISDEDVAQLSDEVSNVSADGQSIADELDVSDSEGASAMESISSYVPESTDWQKITSHFLVTVTEIQRAHQIQLSVSNSDASNGDILDEDVDFLEEVGDSGEIASKEADEQLELIEVEEHETVEHEVKETKEHEVKEQEVKEVEEYEVKEVEEHEVKEEEEYEVKEEEEYEVKEVEEHEVKEVEEHEVKEAEEHEVKEAEEHEVKEVEEHEVKEVDEHEVKEVEEHEVKEEEEHEVKEAEEHDVKEVEEHEVKEVDEHEVKEVEEHEVKEEEEYEVKEVEEHEVKEEEEHEVKEAEEHDVKEVEEHEVKEVDEHEVKEVEEHEVKEIEEYEEKEVDEYEEKEIQQYEEKEVKQYEVKEIEEHEEREDEKYEEKKVEEHEVKEEIDWEMKEESEKWEVEEQEVVKKPNVQEKEDELHTDEPQGDGQKDPSEIINQIEDLIHQIPFSDSLPSSNIITATSDHKAETSDLINDLQDILVDRHEKLESTETYSITPQTEPSAEEDTLTEDISQQTCVVASLETLAQSCLSETTGYSYLSATPLDAADCMEAEDGPSDGQVVDDTLKKTRIVATVLEALTETSEEPASKERLSETPVDSEEWLLAVFNPETEQMDYSYGSVDESAIVAEQYREELESLRHSLSIVFGDSTEAQVVTRDEERGEQASVEQGYQRDDTLSQTRDGDRLLSGEGDELEKQHVELMEKQVDVSETDQLTSLMEERFEELLSFYDDVSEEIVSSDISPVEQEVKDASTEGEQMIDHREEFITGRSLLQDLDTTEGLTIKEQARPETLETDIGGVDSTAEELVTEITDIDSRHEELVTEITDVDSTAEEPVTEIIDVDTTREEPVTELTDVETTHEEQVTEITDVDTTREELVTEITDVDTTREELVTEITDVDTTREELVTEITDVDTTHEELVSEITDVDVTREEQVTETRDDGITCEALETEITTDALTEQEDLMTEVTEYVDSMYIEITTGTDATSEDLKTDIAAEITTGIDATSEDLKTEIAAEITTGIDATSEELKTDIAAEIMTGTDATSEDLKTEIAPEITTGTDATSEDLKSEIAAELEQTIDHREEFMTEAERHLFEDSETEITDVHYRPDETESTADVDIRSDVMETEISEYVETTSTQLGTQTKYEHLGSEITTDVVSKFEDLETEITDVDTTLETMVPEITDETVTEVKEDTLINARDLETEITAETEQTIDHKENFITEVQSSAFEDLVTGMTAEMYSKPNDIGAVVRDVDTTAEDLVTEIIESFDTTPEGTVIGDEAQVDTTLEELVTKITSESEQTIEQTHREQTIDHKEAFIDELEKAVFEDTVTDITDVDTKTEDISTKTRDVDTTRDTVEITDVDSRLEDTVTEITDVDTTCDTVTEITDVDSKLEDIVIEITDVDTIPGDIGTAIKDIDTILEDTVTEFTDAVTKPEDIVIEITDVDTRPDDIVTEITDVGTTPEDTAAEITDVDTTRPEDIVTEITDVDTTPEDAVTEITEVDTTPEDAVDKTKDVDTTPEEAVEEIKDIETTLEEAVTEITSVDTTPEDAVTQITEVDTPEDAVTEITSVDTTPEDAVTEFTDAVTKPEDIVIEITDVDTRPDDIVTEITDVGKTPEDTAAEITDVDTTRPEDIVTEITDVDTTPEDAVTEITEVDTTPEDAVDETKDVDTTPEEAVTEITDVDKTPEDAVTEITGVDTTPEDADTEIRDVDTTPEDAVTEITDIDTTPEDADTEITDVDTTPEDAVTEITGVDTRPEDIVTEITDVDITPEDAMDEIADGDVTHEDVVTEMRKDEDLVSKTVATLVTEYTTDADLTHGNLPEITTDLHSETKDQESGISTDTEQEIDHREEFVKEGRKYVIEVTYSDSSDDDEALETDHDTEGFSTPGSDNIIKRPGVSSQTDVPDVADSVSGESTVTDIADASIETLSGQLGDEITADVYVDTKTEYVVTEITTDRDTDLMAGHLETEIAEVTDTTLMTEVHKYATHENEQMIDHKEEFIDELEKTFFDDEITKDVDVGAKPEYLDTNVAEDRVIDGGSGHIDVDIGAGDMETETTEDRVIDTLTEHLETEIANNVEICAAAEDFQTEITDNTETILAEGLVTSELDSVTTDTEQRIDHVEEFISEVEKAGIEDQISESTSEDVDVKLEIETTEGVDIESEKLEVEITDTEEVITTAEDLEDEITVDQYPDTEILVDTDTSVVEGLTRHAYDHEARDVEQTIDHKEAFITELEDDGVQDLMSEASKCDVDFKLEYQETETTKDYVDIESEKLETDIKESEDVTTTETTVDQYPDTEIIVDTETNVVEGLTLDVHDHETTDTEQTIDHKEEFISELKQAGVEDQISESTSEDIDVKPEYLETETTKGVVVDIEHEKLEAEITDTEEVTTTAEDWEAEPTVDQYPATEIIEDTETNVVEGLALDVHDHEATDIEQSIDHKEEFINELEESGVEDLMSEASKREDVDFKLEYQETGATKDDVDIESEKLDTDIKESEGVTTTAKELQSETTVDQYLDTEIIEDIEDSVLEGLTHHIQDHVTTDTEQTIDHKEEVINELDKAVIEDQISEITKTEDADATFEHAETEITKAVDVDAVHEQVETEIAETGEVTTTAEDLPSETTVDQYLSTEIIVDTETKVVESLTPDVYDHEATDIEQTIDHKEEFINELDKDVAKDKICESTSEEVGVKPELQTEITTDFDVDTEHEQIETEVTDIVEVTTTDDDLETENTDVDTEHEQIETEVTDIVEVTTTDDDLETENTDVDTELTEDVETRAMEGVVREVHGQVSAEQKIDHREEFVDELQTSVTLEDNITDIKDVSSTAEELEVEITVDGDTGTETILHTETSVADDHVTTDIEQTIDHKEEFIGEFQKAVDQISETTKLEHDVNLEYLETEITKDVDFDKLDAEITETEKDTTIAEDLESTVTKDVDVDGEYEQLESTIAATDEVTNTAVDLGDEITEHGQLDTECTDESSLMEGPSEVHGHETAEFEQTIDHREEFLNELETSVHECQISEKAVHEDDDVKHGYLKPDITEDVGVVDTDREMLEAGFTDIKEVASADEDMVHEITENTGDTEISLIEGLVTGVHDHVTTETEQTIDHREEFITELEQTVLEDQMVSEDHQAQPEYIESAIIKDVDVDTKHEHLKTKSHGDDVIATAENLESEVTEDHDVETDITGNTETDEVEEIVAVTHEYISTDTEQTIDHKEEFIHELEQTLHGDQITETTVDGVIGKPVYLETSEITDDVDVDAKPTDQKSENKTDVDIIQETLKIQTSGNVDTASQYSEVQDSTMELAVDSAQLDRDRTVEKAAGDYVPVTEEEKSQDSEGRWLIARYNPETGDMEYSYGSADLTEDQSVIDGSCLQYSTANNEDMSLDLADHETGSSPRSQTKEESDNVTPVDEPNYSDVVDWLNGVQQASQECLPDRSYTQPSEPDDLSSQIYESKSSYDEAFQDLLDFDHNVESSVETDSYIRTDSESAIDHKEEHLQGECQESLTSGVTSGHTEKPYDVDDDTSSKPEHDAGTSPSGHQSTDEMTKGITDGGADEHIVEYSQQLQAHVVEEMEATIQPPEDNHVESQPDYSTEVTGPAFDQHIHLGLHPDNSTEVIVRPEDSGDWLIARFNPDTEDMEYSYGSVPTESTEYPLSSDKAEGEGQIPEDSLPVPETSELGGLEENTTNTLTAVAESHNIKEHLVFTESIIPTYQQVTDANEAIGLEGTESQAAEDEYHIDADVADATKGLFIHTDTAMDATETADLEDNIGEVQVDSNMILDTTSTAQENLIHADDIKDHQASDVADGDSLEKSLHEFEELLKFDEDEVDPQQAVSLSMEDDAAGECSLGTCDDDQMKSSIQGDGLTVATDEQHKPGNSGDTSLVARDDAVPVIADLEESMYVSMSDADVEDQSGGTADTNILTMEQNDDSKLGSDINASLYLSAHETSETWQRETEMKKEDQTKMSSDVEEGLEMNEKVVTDVEDQTENSAHTADVQGRPESSVDENVVTDVEDQTEMSADENVVTVEDQTEMLADEKVVTDVEDHSEMSSEEIVVTDVENQIDMTADDKVDKDVEDQTEISADEKVVTDVEDQREMSPDENVVTDVEDQTEISADEKVVTDVEDQTEMSAEENIVTDVEDQTEMSLVENVVTDVEYQTEMSSDEKVVTDVEDQTEISAEKKVVTDVVDETEISDGKVASDVEDQTEMSADEKIVTDVVDQTEMSADENVVTDVEVHTEMSSHGKITDVEGDKNEMLVDEKRAPNVDEIKPLTHENNVTDKADDSLLKMPSTKTSDSQGSESPSTTEAEYLLAEAFEAGAKRPVFYIPDIEESTDVLDEDDKAILGIDSELESQIIALEAATTPAAGASTPSDSDGLPGVLTVPMEAVETAPLSHLGIVQASSQTVGEPTQEVNVKDQIPVEGGSRQSSVPASDRSETVSDSLEAQYEMVVVDDTDEDLKGEEDFDESVDDDWVFTASDQADKTEVTYVPPLNKSDATHDERPTDISGSMVMVDSTDKTAEESGSSTAEGRRPRIPSLYQRTMSATLSGVTEMVDWTQEIGQLDDAFEDDLFKGVDDKQQSPTQQRLARFPSFPSRTLSGSLSEVKEECHEDTGPLRVEETLIAEACATEEQIPQHSKPEPDVDEEHESVFRPDADDDSMSTDTLSIRNPYAALCSDSTDTASEADSLTGKIYTFKASQEQHIPQTAKPGLQRQPNVVLESEPSKDDDSLSSKTQTISSDQQKPAAKSKKKKKKSKKSEGDTRVTSVSESTFTELASSDSNTQTSLDDIAMIQKSSKAPASDLPEHAVSDGKLDSPPSETGTPNKDIRPKMDSAEQSNAVGGAKKKTIKRSTAQELKTKETEPKETDIKETEISAEPAQPLPSAGVRDSKSVKVAKSTKKKKSKKLKLPPAHLVLPSGQSDMNTTDEQQPVRVPSVYEPQGDSALCGPASLARLSPDISSHSSLAAYSQDILDSKHPWTLDPVADSNTASTITSRTTSKDRSSKKDISKARKSPVPRELGTVDVVSRGKSGRSKSRSRQTDAAGLGVGSRVTGLLSVTSASETEAAQSARGKKKRRKRKKKDLAETTSEPVLEASGSSKDPAASQTSASVSSRSQSASRTTQRKMQGLSSGSSKDRSTDFTSIDQSDDSDEEGEGVTTSVRMASKKQGRKDSNISRGLGLLGARRKRRRRKNIVVVATPKHF